MRTARIGDWDDQDSTAGSEPAPQQARTRRALLGAAAGGFALAASGLFLPPTIEKAEAREGANGGELGGRHGTDQRGRHRRRTHGDQPQNGNKDTDGRPQSSINLSDVAFEIQNHLVEDVQFQPWEWDANKKRWDGGDWVTLSPPGPDDSYFVRATDGRLAFRIGTGYFVLARDVNDQTALLEIGEGTCAGDGCSRGRILVSKRLREGEAVSAANIEVTRLRNTKRVLCHIDLV